MGWCEDWSVPTPGKWPLRGSPRQVEPPALPSRRFPARPSGAPSRATSVTRSGPRRSTHMRALLALLLLLTGCGGAQPAGGLDGEVRFSRGGGIAGVQDELVIAPD